MRVALVNPRWSFANSIYFGCREPHLPLELGYARARLLTAGHAVSMLDGALDDLSNPALAEAVAAFGADMTVVTTAPSYLFWRCAQPELTIPADFLRQLGGRGGMTVVVGPHGSATPAAVLAKLGVDVVVRGECEEVVERLASGAPRAEIGSIAYLQPPAGVVSGAPAAASFVDSPALSWPDTWIARHRHHHHRFGDHADVAGAEVEASRGCPYSCSFCAKIDFRDKYRRRALVPLLAEIDRLVTQGVGYLYFVDEIFLPNPALVEALAARPLEFGIQTRIDLWKPEQLDALGAAGCVSIEAGVESLTFAGRAALDKKCKASNDELEAALVRARRSVPFVQANLIASGDDPAMVADWRDRLRAQGVWANDPVPLYPYPSSPDYRKLWGAPDDRAWERAHAHYLAQVERFSDIQDDAPLSLAELEAPGACR
ncbi:MAG: TIGR04295 family B12-binding domain-containing radical SAM protein [Janthinobacterium lividum]